MIDYKNLTHDDLDNMSLENCLKYLLNFLKRIIMIYI